MLKTNYSTNKSENAIRPIIVTAVMFFIVLTGIAQNDLSKSFNGIKEIQINTVLGDCKITRSPNPNVSLTLHHTFNDPAFRTSVDQQDSILVIKETFKGRNILQNGTNPKASWTII